MGDDGTGGIVWKAEVYHIRHDGRQGWYETVFPQTVHIDNAIISSVFEMSRSAGHHICIQIRRVDRIRNGDIEVCSEYLLYVSGVAFGAIADEYFIRGYGRSPGLKIGLCDLIP